ncbi:MAG: hypothetical protein JWQ72_3299 [Polaromonas sp.]|nr:hypothetical protein [Polaromonas sp.]
MQLRAGKLRRHQLIGRACLIHSPMQLTQRRRPLSKTTYHIADQLEIREESLFRTVDARIGLERVSVRPLQVREFPVRWAVASAFFWMLAVFALIDGWASRDMASIFGFLLVAGCALACSYNTWQLHRNLFVFRDRHTNQTLFVMLRASPSSSAVDAFVNRLNELADRPRPRAGSSKHEVAAFHKQVVQQLLEDGVLLPEEYEAVVHRLQQKSSTAHVVRLHSIEP